MMEGGSLSQEDVSYRQQASLWPLPGLARDAETLDFLPWPGSRTLSEKPTLMGSVHLFSFLAETPILLISSSFTLGPLSVWEQDCHAWPASLFPVCICQASAHWGTVYSVLDLIGGTFLIRKQKVLQSMGSPKVREHHWEPDSSWIPR